MSPFLELGDLVKRFGEHVVLDGISLSVDEGETLALLGPSGSGKTTLLRMIAGFEAADRGTIRVAGEDVTGLPPSKRHFGLVFQHYALFPHLTVGQNVEFGLEDGTTAATDRKERVAEVLDLVDLTGFEDRRIHQISGGQQQRVALARALAPRPRVLLLDEPLSNLDRSLRERTRREIGQTLSRVGITAVWVTHEQDEAFDVGDRVAVLNQGHLEQWAPPEVLYLEPATRFVAGFVGRASSFPGRWLGDGQVELAGEPSIVWAGETQVELGPGAAVELVFRPEALELTRDELEGLPVRITERRYAGSQTFFTVETRPGDQVEVVGDSSAAAVGEDAAVRPRPGASKPRVFAR